MRQRVELRRMGQSDLQLSAIGLGCWQFSKGSGMVGKFWPVLADEDIVKIVKTSIDGGMNWFDTAEVYGWGKSEEALAHALDQAGDLDKQIHIATKWWPMFRTAASIGNTIEERIQALQGRTIDVYQIHQPYSYSSISSQMKAMAELVQDGKVRYVGVSNFSAKQMREAHKYLAEYGFQLVSNQVKYSMLDRRIEKNGIMDTAKELGISIIAYSPLEQGILTGKFHQNPELILHSKGVRKYQAKFKIKGLEKTKPIIEELEKLAEKYAATPAQIALNWLIHYHGDIVFAIPGASKVHHAEDNIGSLSFQLSKDELEGLSVLTEG